MRPSPTVAVLRPERSMMRFQNGAGAWDTIFWIACAVFAIWVWVPDLLPAEAADIHSLAVTAQANEEAKGLLAEELKTNPNPSRGELRKVQRRINEILVTAKSREVTGDKTLKSPAQQEKDEGARYAARLAQIEAKSVTNMNSDEFALAMFAVVLFGIRFASVQRSY